MLRQILKSLIELVVAPTCPSCGRPLSEKEGAICVDCRFDLPYTYDSCKRDNYAFLMLDSFHPVVWAGSYCYYKGKDGFTKLIFAIKYRGQKHIASHLGRAFATELVEKGSLPEDVDVVIPVPLHKFRYYWRGYNQSDYIAKAMAEVLGCDCELECVKRIVNTKSQTSLESRKERIFNTDGIFRVIDGSKLDNRHILIVDDVLTTGSTIKSLIALIIDSCEGCRISVATLARTEKH
ncbi:MAG: phosphoribosyltransferase family protein [Rikenellaceae bacterium]